VREAGVAAFRLVVLAAGRTHTHTHHHHQYQSISHTGQQGSTAAFRLVVSRCSQGVNINTVGIIIITRTSFTHHQHTGRVQGAASEAVCAFCLRGTATAGVYTPHTAHHHTHIIIIIISHTHTSGAVRRRGAREAAAALPSNGVATRVRTINIRTQHTQSSSSSSLIQYHQYTGCVGACAREA
jgi:hypothetical protein